MHGSTCRCALRGAFLLCTAGLSSALGPGTAAGSAFASGFCSGAEPEGARRGAGNCGRGNGAALGAAGGASPGGRTGNCGRPGGGGSGSCGNGAALAAAGGASGPGGRTGNCGRPGGNCGRSGSCGNGAALAAAGSHGLKTTPQLGWCKRAKPFTGCSGPNGKASTGVKPGGASANQLASGFPKAIEALVGHAHITITWMRYMCNNNFNACMLRAKANTVANSFIH